MSSKMNFSGFFKRVLKGDLDPGNIFGFNPSRAELRANAAERGRRASQIEFEQGDELLRESGGSVDPATKQIGKLRYKTQFLSMSPAMPRDPTGIALVGDIYGNKKKADKSKKRLAASNESHANTALLAENLKKTKATSITGKRLSDQQIRQSILGSLRVPRGTR